MPATSAGAAPIQTDALIIGAGPVGLFQVFELGLLGIKAHVVDTLTRPGGQPLALYPDKPIYDIPGVLVCTGQELTERLLTQIAPFNAAFHLGTKVCTLAPLADGRFLVGTSGHIEFITKTIFLAAGVGAFEPRTLPIAGIERFEQSQLFYHEQSPQLGAALGGTGDLLIVGGNQQAVDCAIRWASQDRPKNIVLLHRRDSFQADAASVAHMRALCVEQKMQCMVGQITGYTEKNDRLVAVDVMRPDGTVCAIPTSCLLVLLGLSPKLGPIAHWGLQLERKQVPVNTETFSTQIPGIFAIGDINTYAGKKKLIVCGFHECVLAAFAAAALIDPANKAPLQYTTTSTQLQQRLGIKAAASS